MPKGSSKSEKRAAAPKKLTPAEQAAQFKKTARDLGCDETPGALDRAFGRIEPSTGRKVVSQTSHEGPRGK
jgi:hypothetical protein